MLRSLAALAAVLVLAGAVWLDPLPIAQFSTMEPGAAIDGWEPLTFDDAPETAYTLVADDDGTTVVKAVADASAGGLIKRLDVDPTAYPVLAWRWKVDNLIEKGNVRSKRGDDYPARIYVTFDYDPSDLSFGDRIKYRALKIFGYDDIPVRSLNYIWANKSRETEIVPNAYTSWVQMVPVESGDAHVGEWRTAERNLLDDYRAAFDEEPPPINGIAIMTDADNTEEAATAYFGDIEVRTAE